MLFRNRKIVLTGLSIEEKHNKLLSKLRSVVWQSFFKGENDKLDRVFDQLLFCDYIEEQVDILKLELAHYYEIIE